MCLASQARACSRALTGAVRDGKSAYLHCNAEGEFPRISQCFREVVLSASRTPISSFRLLSGEQELDKISTYSASSCRASSRSLRTPVITEEAAIKLTNEVHKEAPHGRVMSIMGISVGKCVPSGVGTGSPRVHVLR